MILIIANIYKKLNWSNQGMNRTGNNYSYIYRYSNISKSDNYQIVIIIKRYDMNSLPCFLV